MYRAIIPFCDLQDDGRSYEAGETYPRPGLAVSEARLDELSTNSNRMGFPLIRFEADPEPEEKPKSKRKPKKKVE